jgi:hypothetical protein
MQTFLIILLLIAGETTTVTRDPGVTSETCPRIETRHYLILRDTIVTRPSSYDDPELGARAKALLMTGYGKEEDGRFWYGWENLVPGGSPILVSVTRFEADTNLVLLGYRCEGETTGAPVGLFFFGYVSRSDKLYLLSDGFGPTVEEVYNQMLTENPGILQIPDFCVAALLLRLKYRVGRPVILRDWADLQAYLEFRTAFTPLPDEARNRLAMFSISPASDAVFMRHTKTSRDAYISDTSRSRDFFQRLTAGQRRVDIVPPSVVGYGDSTRISLTVYNMEVAGEVAHWDIVLAATGHVLSMRYSEEPQYQVVRGTPLRYYSPYKRMGAGR